MAYIPPLNGGRINATISGNTAGAGSLVSTGTLTFAGGNNITLSQAGNAITISGPNALTSQSNQVLSASNGSFAFQTAGFSNANGVTFGTSAGSIMTASVNTSYAASNHSHGNPTLNLTNLSGTTASASNGLTLSLSAASQSNQVISAFAGSNTYSSTSGTLNASSMGFVGSGNVSVGVVNGSVMISGPNGGGGLAFANSETTYTSGTVNLAGDGQVSIYSAANQSLRVSIPGTSSLSATGALSISTNGATISMGAPAFSLGMSSSTYGGGTGGTSGTASNQMVLAAGSNITLSQSTGAGGNTLAIFGPNALTSQSNQTIGILATGNTSGQSSSNTLNATNFNISAQGGLYAGMSGNTLQLSAATTYAASNHSHGNPTLNLTNISGTTASASNGLTLSLSAAPGGGAGLSAGTQSVSTGTVNFANSNGITFGMSGSNQITASHNAITSQSVQTMGLYGLGNTTQNSSTTLDARSISLNGLGALTVGYSNNSVQLSAPGVSSISATGALSISNNGNTVSIGVPAVSMGVSTGGNILGNSGTVSNQLIFAGGNNITLSQSTGAGGNTISIVGGAGGGGAGLSAGTQSVSTGTVNFANSNGITFGMSGSNQITASHNAITSQSVQTQSNIQGIIASGSTNRTGDISFANGNNITFGLSNNTVTASYSQSVQTQNMVSFGGSTGNIIVSNANNVTFGAAGSTVTASASFSQSIQTQGVNAVNLGGNTAGAMASISSGALSLYGGNNITLSQNANSVTIIGTSGGGGGVAIAGGATSFTNGTVNLGASGALTISTVATSGQSLNFSVPATSSLSATGAVSISTNGSTISIGAPNSFSAYAVSNTVTNATTSGTIGMSALSFRGVGNASVGISNGSVVISASGGGGGGGVAMQAGANSITSGTASISGVNLTASINGQTLSISAPATSSFVATNGLSLSMNGSTVSIGQNNTIDYYQNMDRGTSATLAVPYATNGNTLMLQRLNQENDLFAGNINLTGTLLLNMTASGMVSSAQTLTGYIGIYSDNITALSLLSSASTSWGSAANASISNSFSGNRWFSFVSSQWNTAPNLVQGGDYVFGVFFRASSVAMPLSYLGQSYMASNARSGLMGAGSIANNTLGHGNFWNAYYSTSVTAFPTTIASNAVTRSSAFANFMPHVVLNNRYSGTF